MEEKLYLTKIDFSQFLSLEEKIQKSPQWPKIDSLGALCTKFQVSTNAVYAVGGWPDWGGVSSNLRNPVDDPAD